MTLGMAKSLQDEVTAGRMTLADAESEFRKRGKRMIFDNRQEHVVAYRTDTNTMMNAANPQLDGKKNNVKDANGLLIVPAVLETARRSPEGGTLTYYFPRPVADRP
jgi:methyl-accepting chemotaxis protein